MNMPTSRTIKQVIKEFEERVKDMPYVSDDEHRKYIEKERKKVYDEKIANNIPPLYWNAKIDSSIKINPKKSFYLDGEAGRGKTRYLYSLVKKDVLEDKKTLNIVYFPDICIKYKNAPFEEKESILSSLKEKPKLVFDDLGAEVKSNSSLELLTSVLNYRVENLLYLSFTSNMGIGKLPYDDARIKSRIAGLIGKNKFTILSGKDMRL